MVADKKAPTLTNSEFAKTDGKFNDCCTKANIKPTGRQASKWRRQTGKAYSCRNLNESSGGET